MSISEKNKQGEGRKSRCAIRAILAAVLWVTIQFGVFQTVSAQQKPKWLVDYPADPRYYIGIGGTIKTEGDTEFQKRATNDALSALISQIEVNVASVSELLVQEMDGRAEDVFSMMAVTQAQKTIENYEVVDTWDNGKEHWVYLRLPKQQYQMRLQQKVDIAQQQAFTAYTEGLNFYEKGDYISALDQFAKGVADVVPYVDRLKEIPYKGTSVNIFAELRTSIQKALTEFSISGGSGPSEAQVGKPGKKPFNVTVITKSDQKPVEGLPIEFIFVKGAGEIESPVLTDRNGKASAILTGIRDTDKLQIVNGRISLLAMLAENQKNEFVQNVFNSLSIPSRRFVLNVKGVPVFLGHEEIFLGEKKITNYMEPVLKQKLTEAGYTFVDDPAEAEFFIELITNTKKGSKTYGLFSAFLEYRVSVTSLLSGEEIASYAISDIKGISDSYEKAGAKAFEAGIDSLQQNLVLRLIQRIQN